MRPIDGLELDVPAGSLAILLGPSGCGKTTLLSCLGGILSPTSGRISFGDVDVTGLDGRAMAQLPAPHGRHRVPGVQPRAEPDRAGERDGAAAARPACPRARGAQRAEELLERVGLQDRMTHRPGDLSGGQQQRVAVARALALDPPLLLADEPTAHLDFIQVEEVLRLVRELASGERVVVVATHDHRMLPLADRVVELVPQFADDRPRRPRRSLLDAGVRCCSSRGRWATSSTWSARASSRSCAQLADGGEELLAVSTAGDYFGEIGPLFGMPRSATVRARTDAIVIGYTVQAFRERLGPAGVRDLIEHRELAPPSPNLDA